MRFIPVLSLTNEHGITSDETAWRGSHHWCWRDRYFAPIARGKSTTNGSVGIGAAVAKGFARSGCTKIAITDINPDTLKQTKDAILSINLSIEVFDKTGDVAQEDFIDSFTDEATSKFSRLDYAVNCAGVLGSKPVKSVEMTMDAFDRLNNINYRGSWLSSRAQLRNMLKQDPLSGHHGQRGSIVNIASQLGIVARPGAGGFKTKFLIDRR